MKIIPTSVLCRKADVREVASIYCKAPGPSEKRHALAARYLQLEGKWSTIARVAGFAIDSVTLPLAVGELSRVRHSFPAVTGYAEFPLYPGRSGNASPATHNQQKLYSWPKVLNWVVNSVVICLVVWEAATTSKSFPNPSLWTQSGPKQVIWKTRTDIRVPQFSWLFRGNILTRLLRSAHHVTCSDLS